MSLILPILIICLLAAAIYRFRCFHLEGLPVWTSVALFGVKLFFGFAQWAVYTFYYTDRSMADIYKFYDDAHYVHQAWGENKTAFCGLMTGSEDSTLDVYTSQMHNWDRNFNNSVPFNENRFMIRLNTLMMFVSGENIYVHTVLFCFISFLGSILMLHAFQSLVSTGKKKWVLITVLSPSFLFWASGALKESIIMLGLGLLLYGFFMLRQRRVLGWLSFLAGAAILILIKYFLLLCLLPALIGYYLFARRTAFVQVLTKYSLVLVIAVIAIIVVAPLSRKLDFTRIITKKQKHAMAESAYMKAGSHYELPEMDQSVGSIIKLLPTGLWTTMVRPYPWEVRNPMMALAALENVLILILLLLSLILSVRRGVINYNVLFFLLTAVVTYFSLIAIETANFGNLARYKVVMIPLLLMFMVYIVDEKKLPFLKENKD